MRLFGQSEVFYLTFIELGVDVRGYDPHLLVGLYEIGSLNVFLFLVFPLFGALLFFQVWICFVLMAWVVAFKHIACDGYADLIFHV